MIIITSGTTGIKENLELYIKSIGLLLIYYPFENPTLVIEMKI